MEIPSFCMPAKVYLVLSLLGMAFTLFAGYSFFVFAINIVFTFLWAWVLNWLCNKGYSSISWLLVLLPFFFFMLIFLLMFSLTLMSLPYATLNSTPGPATITPITHTTPHH